MDHTVRLTRQDIASGFLYRACKRSADSNIEVHFTVDDCSQIFELAYIVIGGRTLRANFIDDFFPETGGDIGIH